MSESKKGGGVKVPATVKRGQDSASRSQTQKRGVADVVNVQQGDLPPQRPQKQQGGDQKKEG